MSWQGSVIAALGTKSYDGGQYQITRRAQITYDPATGDATTGAISALAIDAIVQPSAGRTILPMVEGRHTTDTIEILTEVELFAETPSNQADRVAYLGGVYEVLKVDGPLSLAGGSHFQVYAARLSVP